MTGLEYIAIFGCVWGGSGSFFLGVAAVLSLAGLEKRIIDSTKVDK